MNWVSWAQSQSRRPVASMTISTSSSPGEVSLDRSDESLSLVAPCAVLNESFRADAVSVRVARVEGPGWSSAWRSAGLSAVSGGGGGGQSWSISGEPGRARVPLISTCYRHSSVSVSSPSPSCDHTKEVISTLKQLIDTGVRAKLSNDTVNNSGK